MRGDRVRNRGKSAVIPAIRRLGDAPYRSDIVAAPLSEVANREKLLPPGFISAELGEAYPPFKKGLPDYVKLRNMTVLKKLNTDFSV